MRDNHPSNTKAMQIPPVCSHVPGKEKFSFLPDIQVYS